MMRYLAKFPERAKTAYFHMVPSELKEDEQFKKMVADYIRENPLAPEIPLAKYALQNNSLK